MRLRPGPSPGLPRSARGCTGPGLWAAGWGPTFFLSSTLMALASLRNMALPHSRSRSDVNWYHLHFRKAHSASSHSLSVHWTAGTGTRGRHTEMPPDPTLARGRHFCTNCPGLSEGRTPTEGSAPGGGLKAPRAPEGLTRTGRSDSQRSPAGLAAGGGSGIGATCSRDRQESTVTSHPVPAHTPSSTVSPREREQGHQEGPVQAPGLRPSHPGLLPEGR